MKSTIEVPVLKYIHLSVVYLVVFLLIGWKESQPPQTTDLVNLDQSPQQVSGGVFIPRNGGFEGRIGQSQVFFNHHAGGHTLILRKPAFLLDPLRQAPASETR